MNKLGLILAGMLALSLFAGRAMGQGTKRVPTAAASETSAGSGGTVLNDSDLRLEGEKRFRANCGRCHQSPHNLPPRMILTIERHMRVRATLTAEDMRAIVAFLTQ